MTGASAPAEKNYTGSAGVLAPGFDACRERVRYDCRAGRTWRAAMDFAVSESGPGWGTKTASR
jgi:hypothetical protein